MVNDLNPEVIKGLKDKIKSVKVTHDPVLSIGPNGKTEVISKARVNFNNGLTLSVIRGGHYTYGGDQGLFEIAIIDSLKGRWASYLFDDEDQGDDVLGHCSEEKVAYYMTKVANYQRKDGE